MDERPSNPDTERSGVDFTRRPSSLDHIWVVPRLPEPSETLMIAKHVSTIGGKGAIQAVACSKLSHVRENPGRARRGSRASNDYLGKRRASSDTKNVSIKVSMIGAVGRDSAGVEIVEALEANRVDTEHILRCNDEQTGRASIALGSSGENNVLVYPGANYKLIPAQLPADFGGISPDLLLLQMEIPVTTVEYLIRKAAARNIPVLFNAALVLESFSRDVLRSVEHLIVNKLEAEDLLDKRQPASPTSWRRLEQGGDRASEILTGRELCRGLLDLGVKYAVVTMGGCGGVAGATNPGGGDPLIIEYKAVEPVKVTDTTGCGGVFIGAYAVQYIR